MADLRTFLVEASKALTYPLRIVGGINVETVTANKTLTLKSSHIQILNPSTGSRDVSLPAVTGLTDGLPYVIRNSGTGGYNLVVKDATPATICTVGQGQYAIVMCDLVGWRVVVAPGVSLLSLAVDTITESTAAAGVTIDGVLLKDGGLTVAAGASTAAAGTTTADAGVLPAGTSSVYPTSAADDTKGVRIHATDKVAGRMLFIGNGVSNKILKVYPASGGTINGASADAAFSSVSGGGVIVVCLSAAGAGSWLAW